jgi:2,4-dienoyl-CoA reductase (NADPH2)
LTYLIKKITLLLFVEIYPNFYINNIFPRGSISMAKRKFEKLLEPFHIGSVKTRNRIVKTGAGTHYSHVSELDMNKTTLAFYEAVARGGAGLIIVESPIIDYPAGGRGKHRYRFDDDKYINGMRELVQTIHKSGCPTFMQMNHEGPWQAIAASKETIFQGPPIAASPVKLDFDMDMHNEMPRELSIAEIEEITDKFGAAAVRAEKAGFDGVDINAGSSHLFHNFLSPFWNKRTDIYGGSIENRARFTVNIIREIKKRLGQNFPVSVLINGLEMGRAIGIDDSECLTAEDSRKAAVLLQEAGADAIQIRSHWLGYHVAGFLPDLFFFPEPPIPLKSFPLDYNRSKRGAGANLYLTAALKKVISIPVIIVGRLDPVLGEKILQEGKADFIGMTRRLFADPELPNKLASGRYDDIAPCTACDTCLEAWVVKRHCRINAALGTEQYLIEKAQKKKKVLVIGGGPGGMEAARVAALRGHEVMLYESSNKLGGLLPLAALVKGLEIEDLPAIIRYLKRQITNLGVKINLGKEVTPSLIDQLKPDVVILAVGGISAIFEIPGINKRKVISNAKLHRMLKFFLRFTGPKLLRLLTKFWMPIGKKVVIIGGGIHGCELAEFLVKRGRTVTIVETSDALGEGMITRVKPHLFKWFQKKGVTTLTGVKYEEITDEGLIILTKEGKRLTLEADNIVPALPLSPNIKLLKNLEGKIQEVYAVGDCSNPRLMVDAISDGWKIGNKI